MNTNDYKKILDILETAYTQSILNGGVAKYSINTGQSQTLVQTHTTAEILNQIKQITQLYNEASGIESGTNINVIRDFHANICEQNIQSIFY
jgi:ABC-type uncharacterized transport system ATPase subunit